jgi:putative redox protein
MEFIQNGETFETECEYGSLTISGDETKGYRPFQLLVSSVAACSGGVLRKILEKKRISFEQIKIQAKVERVVEEANRVSKIHLHIQVKGNVALEKLEKALVLSKKNCPIVQSIKNSIEVTETCEVIPTQLLSSANKLKEQIRSVE